MKIENFDKFQERMIAFWEHGETDRALASIMVQPKEFRPLYSGHRQYYDADAIDALMRHEVENTLYFGDAFPAYLPYFGTSGVAELVGCTAEYTHRTVWFEPCLDEPDASKIEYCHPEIFRRQKELTARLCELANDDYFVTVGDNCSIMDGLASIRGSEELLLDMITDPEFVTEAVEKLLPIYKETQEELFQTVEKNNHGCIHSWMQLWAPRRMAQLQCDMSVMISKEHFDRFVMPELEETTAFLDNAIYHLDGQEQIRHLDSLLSLKHLHAIQWQPVAGQPKVSEFIPYLQKIQQAGKGLMLRVETWEIPKILDQLSCRGLMLKVEKKLHSADEAQELIRYIETHSVDRG